MSKCISSHGEYSEHEGIGDYCDWCGDCNHEAIRRNAKIEALRYAANDRNLNHLGDDLSDEALEEAVRIINWLQDRADQIEENK